MGKPRWPQSHCFTDTWKISDMTRSNIWLTSFVLQISAHKCTKTRDKSCMQCRCPMQHATVPFKPMYTIRIYWTNVCPKSDVSSESTQPNKVPTPPHSNYLRSKHIFTTKGEPYAASVLFFPTITAVTWVLSRKVFCNAAEWVAHGAYMMQSTSGSKSIKAGNY